MRVPWCESLVERMRLLLEGEKWVTSVTRFDMDDLDLPESDPQGRHEPELQAWWEDSGHVHVRMLMGEDPEHKGEDFITSEGRYLFGIICVQGHGGVQLRTTPDEKGVAYLFDCFRGWRKVATALMEGKGKK